MTDLRATLIKEFRAKLSSATMHMPSSMALAAPLGPLADAAIAVFADGAPVPAVPTYRDDLARERHWYGLLRAAELDEGAQYPVLAVHRESAEHVALTLQHGPAVVSVRMPPTDMVDFALAVLSAAYAEPPVQPADVTPVAESGAAT